MNYYTIEAEVAGSRGIHTRDDRSTHPPVVSHLHYEFEGWMGDELVEAFPCYLVTDRLATKIAHLSGFRLAPVEVSFSEQFFEVMPAETSPASMPPWHWLQVTGIPWKDDFFVGEKFVLTVSERALQILRPHIPFAEIAAISKEQ